MNAPRNFHDYLSMWSVLLPGIDLRTIESQPGFIMLVRLWNHTAIMEPEKCDDVVVLDDTNHFVLINNPFMEEQAAEDAKNAKKDEAKSPVPPAAAQASAAAASVH
jgi:hypothetical protein